MLGARCSKRAITSSGYVTADSINKGKRKVGMAKAYNRSHVKSTTIKGTNAPLLLARN
jgi:hypothetical protein